MRVDKKLGGGELGILSGWKEIATYLGKGVRTVQRYEIENHLPIHRPTGNSVIAAKAELDRWIGVRNEMPLSAARLNRCRADFLLIDSEIALTFSGKASQSGDPENRRRRIQVARKAYETIIRMRQGVNLSDADKNQLNANLQQLRRELQSLGEKF